MGIFESLLRETLFTAAVLCLPVLGIAALIGAAVAVFQAATQIQEQTLSLLPKLIGVGLTIACAGSLGMQLCGQLFTQTVQHLSDLTR